MGKNEARLFWQLLGLWRGGWGEERLALNADIFAAFWLDPPQGKTRSHAPARRGAKYPSILCTGSHENSQKFILPRASALTQLVAQEARFVQ